MGIHNWRMHTLENWPWVGLWLLWLLEDEDVDSRRWIQAFATMGMVPKIPPPPSSSLSMYGHSYRCDGFHQPKRFYTCLGEDDMCAQKEREREKVTCRFWGVLVLDWDLELRVTRMENELIFVLLIQLTLCYCSCFRWPVFLPMKLVLHHPLNAKRVSLIVILSLSVGQYDIITWDIISESE